MRRMIRKSRRVRAALGGVIGASLIVGATAAPEADAANFIKTDLDFILTQIEIAEQHAAGAALYVPDNPFTPVIESGLVPKATLPYGLRTVDGEDNNLMPGQERFGAADTIFPRLTAPLFRSADARTFDPDGPGPANVGDPTSYSQKSGVVEDKHPRIVSNLIVDQTSNNPAAVAAAGPGPEILPDNDPNSDLFVIPNSAPDEGLSAPYNSWFTLFGQFFDHGLDLVTKGGNGTVMIPLQPDDPLFNPASPQTNFMVLTRATNQPGPDGQLGTSDDIQEHTNTTTPFVDQNQTYTSHPSHQVFLREYALNADNKPVATGKFLDDANGGLATWADIKLQAKERLGITLSDTDVLNVPELVTDPYGRFIPGANGFAQIQTATGPVEGVAGGLAVPGNARRTGHAFLDDIAHSAAPSGDQDGVPGGPRGPLVADPDGAIGLVQVPAGQPQRYDDELLAAHFITGDGRGNENIGLTTVHFVFHAEHNRLADHVKTLTLDWAQANGAAGLTFLNRWLVTPVASVPATIGDPSLVWNGERVFQAAKFGTEMQYQHLVFEEFARKVQPEVDIFTGYHTDIDPAIMAEFAHTVYRFGHSMLNETLPRAEADGTTTETDLIDLFLNPVAFNETSAGNAGGDAAKVVRGTTRQRGQELDEFVTGALRNNLLGLPLDLAVLNLARGRDTGVPGLNAARRTFFAATGHTALKPYESWTDFKLGIRNEDSLVNFIAAYGTHPSLFTGAGPDGVLGDNPATPNIDESADDTPAIPAGPGPDGILGDDPGTVGVDESLDDTPAIAAGPGPDGILGDDPTTRDESADDTTVTTMADKRAAANLLVNGGPGAPADRLDFLNSTGAYGLVGEKPATGLENVDFWIGGLAEKQMPFGGLLGSSFNYVFETQMEKLQDGDRFYYLARTAGLNFLTALEENSFAEMIMTHTGVKNLPFDVFSRPDQIFEIGHMAGVPGAVTDNPGTPSDESSLTRTLDGTIRYSGGEHVVLGGGAGNDKMRADIGDDTTWGLAGDDNMEGGAGNDALNGNEGDDVLTDLFGIDNIKGGPGNDAISVGSGTGDLTLAGEGDDFVLSGADDKEAFLGGGDDIIEGSTGIDTIFGNEGNDWIEGGAHADLLQGGNGDPFQEDTITGDDVIIGDGGDDDYDSEGGDDIMVAGPGIERNEGMLGFDWVTHARDPQPADADLNFTGLLPPDVEALRDRFDLVEGLSGWSKDDILRGDSRDGAAPEPGHELTRPDLVEGLQSLLGPGVTSFTGGNIIIGGAGSDLIEGRGGDDLIDGDAMLNVKLSDGVNEFDKASQLQARVFNRQVNPGDISIVRRITWHDAGVDTAVFSDVFANYDIDTSNFSPSNPDSRIVVTHARGIPVDGTDTLKNVERLQFADRTVQLGLAAAPAIGTASVNNNDNVADAVVRWTAPPQNLPAVTSFLISIRVNGTEVGTRTAPANATSLTVTGLTFGTTYTFTVAAVNAFGPGPASAPSNAVTPLPAPPVVIGQNPGPGATGFAVGGNINASFSQNVQGVSQGTSSTNVILRNTNTGVRFPANVTYIQLFGFRLLTVNPTGNLLAGTSYTVEILGGSCAAPASGIRTQAAPCVALATTSWSFTTAGVPPAPLALSRAIVPTTVPLSVASRGLPVALTARPGTAVVQVRVFNAKRPKKALARVFVSMKPGKKTIRLKHRSFVRVMNRGGSFRLEFTPGATRTDLGKTTVRRVTVKRTSAR